MLGSRGFLGMPRCRLYILSRNMLFIFKIRENINYTSVNNCTSSVWRILNKFNDLVIFQIMADEKRQRLDSEAILAQGRELSKTATQEQVRAKLLEGIRDNLRDLHLNPEEGRKWLTGKQILTTSGGTQGKIVFNEPPLGKSELCSCVQTKECDIQVVDVGGLAFLLWQQQKGEVISSNVGWIVIEFAPEVSKRGMLASLAIIRDFLRLLIRGEGFEVTDLRMVVDFNSLEHSIVMNIEIPEGAVIPFGKMFNTLLICWPKLMSFTIDSDHQHAPIKVGAVLELPDVGKIPAFTTWAEYEGGVLDILIGGNDPPKHLKLGKKFMIRTGEKLPGFTQLLKDRATFLSDML